MNSNMIGQGMYANYLKSTAAFVKDLVKQCTPEQQAMLRKYELRPDGEWNGQGLLKKGMEESENRKKAARAIVKAMAQGYWHDNGLAKAGVTSTLGYNFFDLRPPVLLAYPVNTPFRNKIARQPRVNDGFGTAAHWQATRNFGTNYPGVPEGTRAATATPDFNSYIATYKELGVERAVTFTAQFAGEGFTDNVADEHIRELHELWLQEESIILMGNSGTATGNNGYALGTPATPTLTTATGTGFASTTNVSVAVVALTPLANPANTQYGYNVAPTVTAGLVPSRTVTSAASEQFTVNGGTSHISAMSSVQSTHNQLAVASVAAVRGATAYAWYVNTTDASSPSLTNALLAAITVAPTYTFGAAATGTQAGSAAGLNVDHSFNALEFDGLLTYAFSTTGAYWVDQGGASLTSNKDGSVKEIETALQTIYTNYQAQVDGIWCSPDTRVALDAAIRYNGASTGSTTFTYLRGPDGIIYGGFVVESYKSKFAISSTGGNAIPINMHPMIPPGVIWFDVNQNPYPTSRAPFVYGLLTQRDYYSIEWPVQTRNWTFGTYVHEVLQHNFPWISGVITSVGSFNYSQ
jgi:hypothetical protein